MYREVTTEVVAETDYSIRGSGWRTKITAGRLEEGQIAEWSPSGEALKINGRWYLSADIEVIEALPARDDRPVSAPC